jgi:PKD repeat protein
MVGRRTALAAIFGMLVAFVTPAAPATAALQQASIVSANPANWTPNVLDGKVEALVQVGNRIIAGGIFTQVQAAGLTGPVLTRSNIFAFDATTGAIDTGFAPVFDDEVTAIAVSADGLSLFVGGAFSNVNGATARKVAKISVTTGVKDPTYSGGANGRVNDLTLSRGRLIIGGQFTSVKNVARADIASLNPTTGDVTNDISNTFAGIHNPTARGGAQPTAVTKFAVDPAGNKLVAIGNFTSVDGVARDQIAMLDISVAPSTLANWYTTEYTSKCSNSFTTYMRDLDISPDGVYVVISTTGAYNGSTSGCDVISRYEMNDVGTNIQSTWRDYTGGDTTYAVAITGTAVYVGGHFRWMNNAFAADAAGPGAVPREGIASLDPASGLPFSWNPGRDRGVGVFDILPTATGLWIGDDTERVALELRERLAFFPLAAGTTPPPNITGTLPTDVYALGGTDPSVLYRVNAGGAELASADDGPNWLADTAASPSPLHTTGSNVTTYTTNVALDATVPNTAGDKPPVTLFSAMRSDPNGGNDMLWSIPVTTGTPITVRLYFANRTGSTKALNVNIDGSATARLSNFTLPTTGSMRSFDVTSDGIVNINFTRQGTNDPQVSGIEILNRNLTATGGTTAAQVRNQNFDGSALSGTLTTTAGTESWGQARGAFVVDGTLYTGFANGTFTARSYDGVTYGSPSTIDLLLGTFAADLPNITGMFYDSGRIYFTLANDANLYYRFFNPQTRIVGTLRNAVTTGTSLTSMAPQRVAGMFKSGSTIYLADKATGALFSIPFANGVVSGSAALTNNAIDWRARGLFVRSGLLPDVPPVALAAWTGCVLNVCSFDGTGSTDSDGSIVSYSWDFGDGATSTQSAPSYAYAHGGDFVATLTVTDDRGTSRSNTVDVTAGDAANQAPTAAFTTSCLNRACTMDASGSSDPDGTVATYAWDFGDGQTGGGATPRHTYATAGTYTVSLVVTDDDAAASVAVTHDVAPTDPPPSTIGFRASATSTTTSDTQRVTEPPTVAAGDELLLFATSNLATSVLTPPAGWNLLGSRTSGTDTQTLLYNKIATDTDASSQPTIVYAATTKAVLTFLAYSGTSSANTIQTVASAAETVSQATHTTPAVTLPIDSSWVVSYWADKSSATTAWTLPAGQIQRGAVAGTGSGRVTSVASDLGESVPAGPSGALSATADSSSARATMWSVVLRAANAPNEPPVAGFTTSCTHLTCTVDGSTSFDADGTVASYAWDFGDGGSDSGATSTHTFSAAGPQTISLTVNDNLGLTSAPVTHVVNLIAFPQVGFRAAAVTSATQAIPKVTVPAAVQAGDAMLLFVTTNALTPVTAAPAGWSPAGTQQTGTDTRTLLFTKVATGTDASTVTSITFSAATKTDLTLLAYSGTDANPFQTVASAGETVSSAAHTTPATSVTDDRSWVVSYWADKSSATTSWTDPPGQVRRAFSAGAGPGRITSLTTDPGAASAVGPVAGLTATADSASARATMWSVVIKAAS